MSDKESVGYAQKSNELAKVRTTLAEENNALARNRTRLANRRTFLAWCRTALSFMTFGFLLEKVDVFLASNNKTVDAVLLNDLGVLGKFAFICGPLLLLFAGWRYYRLEKEIGFEKGELNILPELILFGVILGGALIYVLV
ncbi:YidH family protein [Pseudodesulfovibrio sediminis]|uniref:DUF202 domain-containing protein n=1 Tax=Pseudodesulfovibrio sediminis TaxID=2810563 RepID=A0ABM7P4L9_9BACT|nr:DUF202 domain-containing protein [Pseudodesulfovibrio sediminis]BCS87817.1 hypothetical protein PSDVSF_10590 [Pseudodesulfovibrio sediminis]